MAELKYSDLGLKKTIGHKSFKWNGKDIEIVDYLPIEFRYDIVMITLQKSFENGIYNPIKLDMYYHLNLVYMFTNLVFTEEQRENEPDLYDEMQSSGFMTEFLKNLDADLYAEMQDDIDNISELLMSYNSTAASVLKNFIEDLPANAEAAQKIVDNFDPEKYQAVLDFAKAANGGRSIK